MKIKKSISKILLSLILCVCMLPMPFAFATGEVTVTVSGGSQIAFDAATTEYAVTVPVWYASGVDKFTYEMPTIAVNNAGETVAVTMPAELPGNATFEIAGTPYTISLDLAKNMYANGGAETSAYKFTRSDSGAIYKVTTEAYTGSVSFGKRAASYNKGVVYTENNTLVKGKIYLSSYATRRGVLETEPETPYQAVDTVTSAAGETAVVSFYRDGQFLKTSESAQTHTTDAFDLTADWNLLQAVIKPTSNTYFSDTYDGHYQTVTVGGQVETLWDDLFLGELALAKMSVTDAAGKSASTVLFDAAEGATLNLTGTLLNQLGTKAGFDTVPLSWSYKGAAGLIVENGVVTVPANQATGEYVITATADLTNINNIGRVSASYNLSLVGAKDDELVSLEVTGSGLDLSGCKFSPAITTYTVGVPVRYAKGVDSYAYTMPVISAAPLNDAHEAVVTMPDALPGVATVEVSNGEEVLKTYTINLIALGANVYVEGGFENTSVNDNSNFLSSGQGYGMVVFDDTAYTGSHSIRRVSAYSNGPYSYIPGQSALVKGKTYLSSYATRLAPEVTMASGAEYRLQDAVESSVDGQEAAVTFYLNGVNKGTSTGKANFKNFNVNISSEWSLVEAVVTPTSDAYDMMHYSLDSGWNNNRRQELRLDDIFLGELILGGVRLNDAYGAELPAALSTVEGHTMTLSASAVNQLGTIAGLEGKAEVSAITAVGALPEGVTFENNVLTIAQGATGVVTFSVTATPIGDWTEQEAFTDTIKLTLVDGSFAYVEENGKVISILSHYTGNSALDAVLYHAVYSKDGDTLKLESIVSEDISGYDDEFLYSETELNVAAGQVVKSFLWVKGDGLTPCAVNGVFER